VILLDTNVLSALMNSTPDPVVIRWLDSQAADRFWTTAISVFEIRYGLARLAPGRRRQSLEAAFADLIAIDLAGRIAPVDQRAAEAAGALAAEREAAGRPVDVRDTLIAGIALARRAEIATRNTRHFSDLDVRVVDPWAA
jgi:predicted nucleic acid-binding protein